MSYEVKYIEEFVKRTITGIEETKRMHEEFLQDAQRVNDKLTGIMYGLLYGIMGNLLVQFLYPVVEKSLLGIFDQVFWISSIVSCVAIIGIALTSIKYLNRSKKATAEEAHEKWAISFLEGQINDFKNILERIEDNKKVEADKKKTSENQRRTT
jgi:hypothetical protein